MKKAMDASTATYPVSAYSNCTSFMQIVVHMSNYIAHELRFVPYGESFNCSSVHEGNTKQCSYTLKLLSLSSNCAAYLGIKLRSKKYGQFVYYQCTFSCTYYRSSLQLRCSVSAANWMQSSFQPTRTGLKSSISFVYALFRLSSTCIPGSLSGNKMSCMAAVFDKVFCSTTLTYTGHWIRIPT